MKSFFGEVKGIFNTITLIELIISFIFIVFGVLFFVDSKLSVDFVYTVTGCLLIVAAVSTIFSYLKRQLLFRNNLIYGIVLFLLGMATMIFDNFFLMLLAVYFAIDGIKRINYGTILKHFDESSWFINAAIGLLFIIIGVVAVLTRDGDVIKTTGLCLFFYGVVNIVEIIVLRRRSKYFL